MSLEQKFLEQSSLPRGRDMRLWIGGTLLVWAIMLVAIANMMLQTNNRMAENIVEDQGDALNEIAPAGGPGNEQKSGD